MPLRLLKPGPDVPARFFSLRWKILGAFLALFFAVLGTTLLIVDWSQMREVEAGIRRNLEVTRGTYEALLQRSERQMAAAIRLTAGNYGFQRAVAITRDPATIESAALSVRDQVGVDAVWVTDESGSLYADTSGHLQPGASVAEMPMIASALDEEPASAIQLLGGSLWQIAAVPILAPDLIGVLAAGFRIEDRTVEELKRITRSDVSFVAAGRLFASTLEAADRAVLEAEVASVSDGEMRIIGPRGRRQLVLGVTAAPGVLIFIQRSWDEALAPLRRQEERLFAVGIAGAALTALAGFLISGGVTGSVRKLVAATRRLVEGDYGVRVEIAQRDEIGQLGRAFNDMVSGLQEREKIRSVLQKTVSREIADELLREGSIDLGGAERPVTVLFSDVRDFTRISEGLAPADLVSQLNAYLTCMSAAIESEHGVIDKFVGDAIMALFGVPVSRGTDASDALRAAQRMVAAMDEHNRHRAALGLTPWANGIGVHGGDVVAGTIGSHDRWSYTVIGDAVNLASRLEGLTKH